MAQATTPPKVNGVQDMLHDLKKLSIFKVCDGSDIETANTEKKERARRIKEEKKRRDSLQKRFEEERRQIELEDYVYAQQEQQRMDEMEAFRLSSPSGRGRGKYLKKWSLEQEQFGGSPRGRGRIARLHEEESIGLIARTETRVRDQIQQFTGAENFHNNNWQKEFWHGKKTPETSPSLSSLSSEQFEDARSFESSPFHQSENSPFQSVPSSVSASPVSMPFQPRLSPSPLATSEGFLAPPSVHFSPARKPRSRLAAKFSRNFEDSDDNEDPPPSKDPLAVLSSSARSLAPCGFRLQHDPLSFSGLNPSQRVISKSLIPPEDFVKHAYPITNINEFSYNTDDFPSLSSNS